MSGIYLHKGDVLEAYDGWPSPVAIVSDGPYGVGGFPGDPTTPDRLPEAYLPHVEAWSRLATSATTLWFWCTEIGWAMTHQLLSDHGWKIRGVNVWDKGVGHIAGNCNGKTMRKFPIVTEICVQYVREPSFDGVDIKLWLRNEWERSGLPFSRSNEACGMKSAATRKYFTKDDLFYPPSGEVLLKLARYANAHGANLGKPYFRISDNMPDQDAIKWWNSLFPKFNFEYGATNVWSCPGNRGTERLKVDGKAVHLNQKPEFLFERIIQVSTDPGDVVWDPFCGTGTGAVVCQRLRRLCYTAEINTAYQPILSSRF